jgi:N-acetylmuramoyl-L-alanine amidase
MPANLTSQQAADIAFIGLTVYRESRNQTSLAKLAVAFTIMERVKKRTWFGHDVQAVLFRKWQYSSLTAPNDPQLAVWPANSQETAWIDCLTAAWQAYLGTVANPIPDADSYFSDDITAPDWAKPEDFIAQIGRLRFFNVDRDFEAEKIA